MTSLETAPPSDIRTVALNIQQIDAAIRELAAKQLPLGDDGKPIKVLVNGVEWSGLPAGVFVKFQVTS